MGARVKPFARYEEFPEPELRLKNGPVLVSGVRVARSAWRSALVRSIRVLQSKWSDTTSLYFPSGALSLSSIASYFLLISP